MSKREKPSGLSSREELLWYASRNSRRLSDSTITRHRTSDNVCQVLAGMVSMLYWGDFSRAVPPIFAIALELSADDRRRFIITVNQGFEDSQRGERTTVITPNAVNGERLLKNICGEINILKQNDYKFAVQTCVDIWTHISLLENPKSAEEDFNLSCFRLCIPKIAHRLRQAFDYFGTFAVLQPVRDAFSLVPPHDTFHTDVICSIVPSSVELIRKLKAPPIEMVAANRYRVELRNQNIIMWLDTLDALFAGLKLAFRFRNPSAKHKHSFKAVTLNREKVASTRLLLLTLDCLRPVFHVLFKERVQALSKKSNPKAQKLNMGEDEDEEDDYDEDYGECLPGITEERLHQPQRAADVYLRWIYSLSTSITAPALVMEGLESRSIFIPSTTYEMYQAPSFPCPERLSADQSEIFKRRLASAKCHAEAMLMAKFVPELAVGEVLWIAVCKKCCVLCALLAECLGDQIHIVSGCHGIIFPWILPNVSEEIAVKVLERLKKLLPNLGSSHFRMQSSGLASSIASADLAQVGSTNKKNFEERVLGIVGMLQSRGQT
ncbi:hypothetical protein D9757_014619 [Collybiopsis confluens]|uniref:Uncharacterized protein n=1 Tax=Collybiopsis confluens TaxID=2823264 RepID=A0A8H5C9I2_9AGAR|nr:hypothetical protein D9757_015420 [Collybiopsis confluens]KAF5337712.1 hypothetical protein D9757_014752 [Collybiopsis confluens]KAF5338185.1 hypothetical protein D9757_014619 [Collybiopsis confluens]